MSAQIRWSNSMVDRAPIVLGRLPKKPVIWFGEIYLTMPDGEKDIRAWKSKQPMTCENAKTVLGQLLDMLIGEHGKDSAIDSGFWLKSR